MGHERRGSYTPVQPARSTRQNASWSSAARKRAPPPRLVSNPPMASSATRRKPMLAPWPTSIGSVRSRNHRRCRSIVTDNATGPSSPSTRPATKPTCGSPSAAAMCAVQPGAGAQSSSVNATSGAVVAAMPAFFARDVPGCSQRTTRAPAASAMRPTAGSRDAESTTTSSSPGCSARGSTAKVCSSSAGRSRVLRITTTEAPAVSSTAVRVLIVAAWPPWPLSDGISLILHHHLRLLAPRHEITVLASGRPPGATRPDTAAEGLPTSVPTEWYGPARSGPPDYARRRWASLRTGEPADVFRVEQQPLLGRMDAIIAGPDRPDVVHLHGWTTARLARRTQGIPAVHHSIDAWSEVRGTQAPAGAVRRLIEIGQQRKVVRHEARHLEASRAVAVVAEADALALQRNAPRARIVVVPNGVEPGKEPAAHTTEPVLGFHGALSTVANQDAARVLVEEVLPRVRHELPDTRALVIGRDPPEDLRSDASTGVEVTGEVDDVREQLQRVAVYVAPMATGTGLKNKVLEAMAAGL